MKTLRLRLVIAIVSTIMEEAAALVAVLWLLPKIDIYVPLWVAIPVMIAWAFYSVATFRMGTTALKRKKMIGMADMIGTRGKVYKALAPDGMVKIRGELWAATADNVHLQPGVHVIVTGQERLKLVVREDDEPESPEKPVV